VKEHTVVRLDPGQPKLGQQNLPKKPKSEQQNPQNKAKSGQQKKPQNKETSIFATATNDNDEKISRAKSEGPKTSPQSTTTTPKLEGEVQNSTSSRFPEEHISAVAETPVTVYYGVVLGMILVSLIFGGLLVGLRSNQRKDSCSSFLPSSLPGYHLLLGQREPEGETLCSEEVPESAWI